MRDDGKARFADRLVLLPDAFLEPVEEVDAQAHEVPREKRQVLFQVGRAQLGGESEHVDLARLLALEQKIDGSRIYIAHAREVAGAFDGVQVDAGALNFLELLLKDVLVARVDEFEKTGLHDGAPGFFGELFAEEGLRLPLVMGVPGVEEVHAVLECSVKYVAGDLGVESLHAGDVGAGQALRAPCRISICRGCLWTCVA